MRQGRRAPTGRAFHGCPLAGAPRHGSGAGRIRRTGARIAALVLVAALGVARGSGTAGVPRQTGAPRPALTGAIPPAQAAATGIPAPASRSADVHALSFGPWAAGYVAYAPVGHAFTAVAADFVLPASPPAHPAAGAGSGAWIAIWAGIGLQAKGRNQLIQAGVSMRFNGSAWDVVAPWWINEPVTPTPPHPLPLTLHPGDRIEVGVQLADPRTNTWLISVMDQTTDQDVDAWCYGCASSRNSAGWLIEDPSTAAGYTPFADPGQVRFLGAQAALDGGHLAPLEATNWRAVVRDPGRSQLRQGPVAAPARSDGGFVVADLSGAPGAAPALNGGNAANGA